MDSTGIDPNEVAETKILLSRYLQGSINAIVAALEVGDYILAAYAGADLYQRFAPAGVFLDTVEVLVLAEKGMTFGEFRTTITKESAEKAVEAYSQALCDAGVPLEEEGNR